jgi:hypothetical protein
MQFEEEQKRYWTREQSKLMRLKLAAEMDKARLLVKLQRVSTRKAYKARTLNSEHWTVDMSSNPAQLDTEQRNVDMVMDSGHWTGESGRGNVDTGQWTVNTEQDPTSTGQDIEYWTQNKTGQSKVIKLASRRVGEQIRAILLREPSLSGRAIAEQLNISPTTANKWKAIVENEQQVVNAGH